MAFRSLHVLSLLFLTGLPWGHVTEGDERNGAIFPPQYIDLDFSHSLHIESAGLECIDCHDRASTSGKSSDYIIPTRGQCLDCHDSSEIPERWSGKEKMPGNAVRIPRPNIRFPHSKHLGIEGVSCETCHAGVAEADLARRAHLPAMETCLECHDGGEASGECRTCHLPGSAGTIRTNFPTGTLAPDDHGLLWLKRHEVAAERDLASCASCHQQDDCLSCHDGARPGVFHDGNYLAQHPRDAMANNPSCASCHRMEVFCQDCHSRAGVRLGGGLGRSSFHPEGWMDWPPRRADHHSYVAKKNIASCSACHDGSSCSDCHSWFGPGDDSLPVHGRNWAGSARMRRLKRDNLGLCLECHSLSDFDDPINRP